MGFLIEADNGMYWSSSMTTVFDTPGINTMALSSDQTTSFDFFSTGTGGKYIIMSNKGTAGGVYLRWDQQGLVWDGNGIYATIKASSINSSTEWGKIPDQEKPNFTFMYNTVDNKSKFRLSLPNKFAPKNPEPPQYLKRVLGDTNYIVAQIQQDQFGIFTKIYQ